jgi:hypothetical protein
MTDFLGFLSVAIILLSSISTSSFNSASSSEDKRRLFIVADYGDTSWTVQKNWKCCIDVFTMSGVSSEFQFSEVSTNGLCERPKSGLFYVDIPSNSESIRCLMYYSDSQELFAESVVYQAFSDGVFYLKLSGTGSIVNSETCWSPFAFTAQQLAFLFLKDIDSALPSYINGFLEYETIKKSVVDHMSESERDSSKWDSISWIDTFSGKEVTLSSKYAEIKKAFESEEKEDNSRKSFYSYAAVLLFLLPVTFCVVFLLIKKYRQGKINSN